VGAIERKPWQIDQRFLVMRGQWWPETCRPSVFPPPHDEQKQFHNDAYQVLYRLVSWGTGAGKTTWHLAEVISWCLDNYGITGYVSRPCYPMVRRVFLPTLEIDRLRARWRRKRRPRSQMTQQRLLLHVTVYRGKCAGSPRQAEKDNKTVVDENSLFH